MSTKEELMERAKELGLNPRANTGEAKLLRMIQEAEDDEFNGSGGEPEEKKKISKKQKETKQQRHAKLRLEQKKLVRVIVRCNNDMKKEWKGENIKVSNALHTFTRFVPFDNENGWHIEQAILNTMKEKKCTRFKEVTLPNGLKHRESFLINEYVIEELKPLTKKELEALAKEQAARGSID